MTCSGFNVFFVTSVWQDDDEEEEEEANVKIIFMTKIRRRRRIGGGEEQQEQVRKPNCIGCLFSVPSTSISAPDETQLCFVPRHLQDMQVTL